MTALGRTPSSTSEPAEETANPRFVDVLVFLCAPTAAVASAIGSIDVLGQAIYPFKIVIPALFLASIGRSANVLRRRGSLAQLLLILAGWSIVGLAWTVDRVAGAREASILVFAALAASSLAVACCRPSGVRALLRGWVAAGYLTASVAVWELLTDQHLPSTFVAENESQIGGLVLSTFGNPNNFGAFIVLTVPFIGLVASKAGTGWGFGSRDRIAAQVVALLLPTMLVLSGSRLALLGLGLSGVCYVALSRYWRSAWRLAGGIAALGLVLSVVAISSGLELVGKLEALLDDDPFTIDSVKSRINLVWNGVDFAWRSHGVGIGSGGFEAAMQAGDYRFPVGPGVVNAHNFWIEMLGQYGVFGLGVLVVVLLAATKALFRFRRDNVTLSVERAASICLAGFAGYLVASGAASSYVNSPENWLFIASYLVMVPAISNLRRRTGPTSASHDAKRSLELEPQFELVKEST